MFPIERDPDDGGKGGQRLLAVDTGLAMLVLVVVGTAITANLGDDTVEPGLAAYSFGALLAALMFVRRRWPAATLVVTACALLVYYMLALPPVGLAVPVAAALYSAAEQGRLRWAIGTACALLVISTIVRIREGDDLAYLLGFELVTSIGMMATVIALGDGVRARRGWRAELDKHAYAAVLDREREAERRVEQERMRIARELHDLLGHTVSVIALHTDVAGEALRDDPEGAERSLAVVRGACSTVVRELRASLGALRTTGEDEEGRAPVPGLDQLDDLVAPATAAGLDVRVSTTGTPEPLPAVADATAYRVLQESLSNVLRHAGASTVDIELAYGGDAVLLRIRDDGGGTDVNRHASVESWGIVGMRERLSLLGGSLRIADRQGGGFEVEAHVPLQGKS